MKPYRFLSTVMCLMVVCLVAYQIRGVAADDKQPDDVMAQLKQLQIKIAKLESRIFELEKKPTFITVPSSSPAAIYGNPPYRSPQPIPKEWQEEEFNGMKYYIIPLGTKP